MKPVNDVSPDEAPDVYLHIILWAVISYLVVAAATMPLPIRNRRILRGLAPLAVGFYYWFAAPGIAMVIDLPPAAEPLRLTALGPLLACWFRAERGSGPEETRSG